MSTTTPREQARQLLEQATNLSVRGELRIALQAALDIATRTKRGQLTDLNYSHLKPGDRLLDPERPGFLMRVTKTRKRWFYRWRHPETGLQVESIVGDYPEMSLEEARRLWGPLRAQRLRGELPGVLATADNRITVGELVKKYLKYYALVAKAESSAKSDERLLEANVVERYGTMAAEEFNSDQVREILLPYANAGKGRQAEKVRAVIRTMFEVACGRTRKIDFLEGDTWLPVDHINPVLGATLAEREVVAYKPTTADLRGYVRGLDAVPHGEALRLQLLTCARIGEVVGLPWFEVDLEEGEWNLPGSRTKNGRDHKVMLPTQAVELLTAILARQDNDRSPFVLPQARSTDHHIGTSVVQHALSANRDKLGVSDKFTSHSIRHACLSWLAGQGASKDVRDRVSNHRPARSADAIYATASHDKAARKWLQKWANHLTKLEGRV